MKGQVSRGTESKSLPTWRLNRINQNKIPGWETRSRMRLGFQAGQIACAKALRRRGHKTLCDSKSSLSLYFCPFPFNILFTSLCWPHSVPYFLSFKGFWNRNVPIFKSSVNICLKMLELLIIILKKSMIFINFLIISRTIKNLAFYLNLILNFLSSSFFFCQLLSLGRRALQTENISSYEKVFSKFTSLVCMIRNQLNWGRWVKNRRKKVI